MWYYKKTDYELWTVGCDVAGKWEPESDHNSPKEAAARIAYLNGGGKVDAQILSLLKEIADLASLSKMQPDEDALEKMTSIFMLSVKATALLEL